ncbi:hypothetical protein ACPPVO_28075 [Dactylosporangium sp. McL0621]|uniref:hypothetical protein n=1 Tax=Dactylosporangium sp. McL0621 TaxID=3415678 RepID=UPI003CF3EF99
MTVFDRRPPRRGPRRRLRRRRRVEVRAALFYVVYLFQQAFQFLHMGYASAPSIFLLRQFFLGLPRELFEAARVATQGRRG